jgi:hypothetical protein
MLERLMGRGWEGLVVRELKSAVEFSRVEAQKGLVVDEACATTWLVVADAPRASPQSLERAGNLKRSDLGQKPQGERSRPEYQDREMDLVRVRGMPDQLVYHPFHLSLVSMHLTSPASLSLAFLSLKGRHHQILVMITSQ